jgi:glycosyltransferase involved in cell wall biosynthesis
MNFNIVTVNSGWILTKIADRINTELQKLCNSKVSHEPDLNCDVNFYVDLYNCYRGKTSTIDIGMLTHLDRNDIRTFPGYATSLDHIIHMTSRYYDMIKPYYSEDKMSVMYPAEIRDGFDLKKPVLGIIQRGRWEGKGYDFMLKLAETSIAKSFKFMFVGKDWDGVVDKLRSNGVDVDYHQDESYENYPQHYDTMDYLFIPSLWEGGPMAVIEALAKGVPVISSNVGWVGTDFVPDYIYEPDNLNQLERILTKIIEPLKSRREQVEDLSYFEYAKHLYNIAEGLL